MDKEKLLKWIEITIEESNVTEYIWALEEVRDRLVKGEFDTTK